MYEAVMNQNASGGEMRSGREFKGKWKGVNRSVIAAAFHWKHRDRADIIAPDSSYANATLRLVMHSPFPLYEGRIG